MEEITMQVLKEIIDPVFEYAQTDRFTKRYENSLRLFMDLPPDRGINSFSWIERDLRNFLMWFCFESLEEGKSISDVWLEENPVDDNTKKTLIEALNSSTLALYSVEAEKCTWGSILLKDILGGSSAKLWDPIIYQLRDKPLVFGLRVIKVGDKVLSAADFYVFPREISNDIADFFHRHLQGFYGEEISKPTAFPRGAGYLFNHLRLALQRSDEIVRQMKKHKTDWENKKVEKIICHFLLNDYEKTIEKLQELQNITFLGEEAGYRFYEWYNNPNLAGKDDADAGIVLTQRKLVVHCPNVHCVENLKTTLKKTLKGVAEHVYDTVVKKREQ